MRLEFKNDADIDLEQFRRANHRATDEDNAKVHAVLLYKIVMRLKESLIDDRGAHPRSNGRVDITSK